MTQHPLTGVASAVIAGVLLSVCVVGAQSITPPSSDFTPYIEGELVR